MCGIAGLFNLRGNPIDPALLRRMTETLAHRGPDATAIWVRGSGVQVFRCSGIQGRSGHQVIRSDLHAAGEGHQVISPSVGLGHTRLRIIDVAGGDQPIWNEDRSCLIIFNGEIYNFRELRAELESRGHHLASASDTEVILHAYEEWDEESLERLRGMFAFAIWNERQQELFLARDRMGIKPLYLAWRGETLAFASEMKALLQDPEQNRQIDPAALDAYLSLGYVPGPGTILRGLTSLPAGHSLRLRAGSPSPAPRRYWQLPVGDVRPRSEAGALEELDALLRDVIGRHLISDVPLGVFLSGGVDSSTLVAAAAAVSCAPLRTFSIGFPSRSGYDEAPFARAVARHLGTDHHEFALEPDAVEVLPRLIWHLDQPLADPSAIALYYLSRETRRHVTVALAGEGGDELFGGYERYFWDGAAARYAGLPAALRRGLIEPVVSCLPRLPLDVRRDPFRRARKFVRHAARPATARYFHWFELMTPEIKELLGVGCRVWGVGSNGSDPTPYTLHPTPFDGLFAEVAARGGSPLDAMQFCDTQTMLRDDLLHKCDRVSMAVALEARVPFLDHRLVEWAFTLPPELRVCGRTLKYLLKRWLARHLPGELIHRRKQGFEVPVYEWLTGPLRSWVREILLASDPSERFFDRNGVRRLLERLDGGERVLALPVYTLVSWELWQRQFLGKGGA